MIKRIMILFAIAIILTACRPMKVNASNAIGTLEKRYATQKIALREKAKGKVILKVKRNTGLRLIREGNTWAVVKYKGKRYATRKKYLNAERLPGKKKSQYYINYLRTKGPVYWRDRKYTYFTSRLCPIWMLPAPGLHIDKDGFWCDKWDYIVLGSSIPNKKARKVIATPFGKFGRVYDTGGWSTPAWLCDTAVTW